MFFGALGADGFVGAFGLTIAELEAPRALQRGGCGEWYVSHVKKL
jgi:hypothetical protein